MNTVYIFSLVHWNLIYYAVLQNFAWSIYLLMAGVRVLLQKDYKNICRTKVYDTLMEL